MLSEIIVRLNIRLECVTESVRHEILQFRQVSGTHRHRLEHFKCDELTRAPWQLLPKFDVFDHFLKVKVTEKFWGALPLYSPPRRQARSQKHYVRLRPGRVERP